MEQLITAAVRLFWIWGALSIWPTLRFVARIPGGKLRVLHWLFWLQLFWLAVCHIGAHLVFQTAGASWLDNSHYLVIIGTVSWLAVILALLGLSFRCRQAAPGNHGRDAGT
ncbi:MAG: hypothetical protein R3F42_08540 [Pseudomonadota bacterium]